MTAKRCLADRAMLVRSIIPGRRCPFATAATKLIVAGSCSGSQTDFKVRLFAAMDCSHPSYALPLRAGTRYNYSDMEER